jgi:heme-degrading monooxygenase HmoA
MVTDQSPNNNGWPKCYFAVIFTAQRSLSGDDIYDITADRMVLLARRQPGFLGVESVSGDDGIGITVSYWVDRDAIANWRQQAEHLAAQALGRQEFYDWYRVRVAEVVAERTFIASNIVDPAQGAGDA